MRQSNGMVILDDLESEIAKKSSIVQTEAATPWIHQHQGTSTDFLNGKSSQTETFEDPIR